MSVAAYVDEVYAETFARVRGSLCSEVPNGRSRAGEKRSVRIDLDEHAHWITRRALKARGLKTHD